MMTLEDILSVSYSNVVIMDGYDRIMAINCECYILKNFSKDFLNREVKKIDTLLEENIIRVWLADMKEVKESV